MERIEKEINLLCAEARLYLEEDLCILQMELHILRLHIRIACCYLLRYGCIAILGYYRVKHKVRRGWVNIKRACLLKLLILIVRQLEQTGGLH